MQYSPFNSFQKMMTEKVIPLSKKHPSWERLDGNKGESGVKIFAYFEYKGAIWRVNFDTWFAELEKAYRLFQKGIDPFEVKKTKSGNRCLVLVKAYAKRPKHLYIYYVKDV